MSTLILVRALPGAGKTTVAEHLEYGLQVQHPNTLLVSADDFFHVSDSETHCTYAQLKDPSLLSGSDYARYRVGRSVLNEIPYRFEAALIAHAHVWCMEQVRNELARTVSTGIVVHNTFSQRWEMEAYLQMAKDFDARVHVVSLYDGGCTDEELLARGAHDIPPAFMATLRKNWEMDWKNAPTERAPQTPPSEEKDVQVSETAPTGVNTSEE
jgi:predicted kinase